MSLSSSLSRHQASPIFPTTATCGGKKRGCGFENPEPSSPKVTCIGQVRVKTKKKVKQGSDGGEKFIIDCSEKGVLGIVGKKYATSHQQFLNQHQQDCLRNRNQRWVHLPLTICEALRAFGAEFSCLLPCSSSCFSTSERGGEDKWKEPRGGINGGDANANGQSSCGAVFGRWLVPLQDGEGGKEGEIELVVGGDEEANEDNIEMRSSRRHVLRDFKIDDEIFDGKGRGEEEGRVSICIPPKNALLLMRCRSDPMKMAALTNRFWEAPPLQEEEEGEVFDCKRSIFGEEVVEEIEGDVLKCQAPEEVKEMVVEIENVDSIEVDEVLDLPMEVHDEEVMILEEEVECNVGEERDLKQDTESKKNEVLHKEEELTIMETVEVLIKNTGNKGINQFVEKAEEGCRIKCSSFSSTIKQVEEDRETEENKEVKDQEMETYEPKSDKETEIGVDSERRDQFMVDDSNETVEKVSSLVSSPPKSSVLPDCLLLMMYEPKLSMEVSKETWVCSRDFTRWLPQRHKQMKQPRAKKIDDTTIANSDEEKKRISTHLKKSQSFHQAKPMVAPLKQKTTLVPHRSSCSYPVAPVSMASMIQQEPGNGVGYEAFTLSRCKSEPMRTEGKLVAAQLEPLHRAAFHWDN